jgi:hypothetical protein
MHSLGETYSLQCGFSRSPVCYSGILLSQFYISYSGKIGEKVKALEDKADLLPSDPGQLNPVETADLFIFHPVFSGGRPVQKSYQVEESAFAGAGRPHDSYHLPAIDMEVDSLQDFEFPFSMG